jgi:hypothetical protein
MSPVAADCASADRAPGLEAGELEVPPAPEADGPAEAGELVEDVVEDPQPAARSATVAAAAAHRFCIESMQREPDHMI